jgi:hypothetical protein
MVLLFAARPAAAQNYVFSVEHEHTFGGCRGTLVITTEKVEYKTAHEGHTRTWPYVELQQIKVKSESAVELLTWEDQKRLAGRDRVWKFKLLEGKITPEVSALLTTQATRPLVTSVMPVTTGAPRFVASVKHLHNIGGCAGRLKIFADRITFESDDKPEHSRFWRYADLQNFSQSERFRFEVAAFEIGFGGPRSYNFQLKGDLPAQSYDYIWMRVYPSKFRPDANSSGGPDGPVEAPLKRQ